MLDSRPPRNRSEPHIAWPEWLRRLDGAAGDLNVLLVVFAIGLAALDLTILLSQIVIGQLPTTGRVINQAHPSFAASPT
jgi:hypothetical protein